MEYTAISTSFYIFSRAAELYAARSGSRTARVRAIPRPPDQTDERCTEDGATISRVEKPKSTTYAEVVRASGWQLVTLACEVGGRWSKTCIDAVSELAKFKAKNEPAHLQRAVEFAYVSRWWALLSVSAQIAFAESLFTTDPVSIQPTFAYEPQTSTVVLDCRDDIGPAFSRLPLRG